MAEDVPWWEIAARQVEATAQPSKGLGLAALAKLLDPKTIQTPALDLIDAGLEELMDTPDGRLIITLGPQEGKSTRVSKVFPVAVLRKFPDTPIIAGSYGHDLARRNGRAVRDAIVAHPELGMRVRTDLAAQNEWQLEGHEGGMYAAGVGTALTGRPSKLLIIDDPVKDREEADSETYRERVWNWWLEVASARLAPGAQAVVILTRWHTDDLAGRLLAAEDGHLWKVINIPAEADHNPEKGEVDILGRAPGEFMISARGRTPAQWQAIKTRSGSRTWNSLYQGRPTAAEGGLFKRRWWREYGHDLWLTYPNGTCWVPGDVEVIISADLAYKDLDTSDFAVLQVWMRRGAEVFLLDQVRARMAFTETCQAIRSLSGKWPQAAAKYVEDRANGPAVITALSRTVPGLIPVQPEGSKSARAAAVSPYVEAGNVWLPSPEIAPWVGDLIEECAAFPTGAHDDQVDALSQALNRLLLSPWSDDDLIEPDEFDEDFANIISVY